jgi:hypothetical protein
LALPLGQSGSSLLDFFLIAAGQRLDEWGNMDPVGSLDHALFANARVSEGYIGGDIA